MSKTGLAQLALDEAKAEDKLETMRAKVHSAREKGGIPPKLAEEWRVVQIEAAEARRIYREAAVAEGDRPAPGAAAPATVTAKAKGG